jgi:hypothetical protein
MSAKSSKAKPSRAVPSKPSKQTKAAPSKPVGRSLETVVGAEIYRTWVDMLRVLVPDGRTHRLAPLVAAMLQYAVSVAEPTQGDGMDERSLVQSLLDSYEVGDPSEAKELLGDAVERLFHDAKVKSQRVSARGVSYSIAEDAYSEYIHWFDMLWE